MRDSRRACVKKKKKKSVESFLCSFEGGGGVSTHQCLSSIAHFDPRVSLPLPCFLLSLFSPLLLYRKGCWIRKHSLASRNPPISLIASRSFEKSPLSRSLFSLFPSFLLIDERSSPRAFLSLEFRIPSRKGMDIVESWFFFIKLNEAFQTDNIFSIVSNKSK